MLKQLMCMCLCVACLLATAQEEIIIDNGYLSTQGWGGAVHPSGNYFVRADRTILHAYSTKNGMLFKTYRAECISINVQFSEDGNYLIVSTSGEMGNECRRVIVFDFYSGEMLLNQDACGYIPQPLRPDLLTLALFSESAIQSIETYAYSNLAEPVNTYEFSGTEAEREEYCFNSFIANNLFFNCGIVVNITTGSYVPFPEADVNSFARTVIPQTQQVAIVGSNEDSVVFVNSLTAEYTVRKLPFYGSFFHYLLAEGDSILRFVNITHKRTERWNYKTGSYTTEWLFPDNELTNNACEWHDTYTGSACNNANAVVHNKEYLFDFNNNRITQYAMYVDTALVHPGILYLYPADSARIAVNGIGWKLSEPNIAPVEKQWFTVDRNPEVFVEGKEYKFKSGLKFLYPFTQRISSYRFSAVSYPQNYYNGEDGTGIYTDFMSHVRQPNALAFLNGDTVVMDVYDGVGTISFPERLVNAPDNDAKAVREVIKTKFNKNVLYELNKNLPELCYPFNLRLIEEGAEFPPPVSTLKPGKDSWIEELYNPVNTMYYTDQFLPNTYYKGELVPNKVSFEQARRAYAENLVKVSYSGPGYGLADEYYLVNVLNRYELPNLELAGIYPVNDVVFYPLTFPTLDGRYLRVNYAYGSIEMLDGKLKPIVTLYLYSDRRFVYVTPDGYYWVSKGLNKKISVRKDKEVYPIEQFDMKYNRPDIILERMGYSSNEVIKSYRGAYQKRLQKAGFTESMLQADFHLPEMVVTNINEVPSVTANGVLDIMLKLTDSKYKLDRINVWVNDVPVYGANGISLRKQNTQQYNTTLNVLLSEGANKIQVSTLNSAGAESYRQTLNVTYNPYTPAQAKTYYIGIGVNNYADTTHNLDYADKDVKDLSAAFKDANVTLLTNEQATRQNILALKKQLLQTNIEDKVIISISGHGLLSDNYDYYLATYDVDFSKPEVNGLLYNDLEQLLDSIPARKKLLLIDACHSGEVDKDELQAMNTARKDGIKGAYVEYAYKPKLGMKNSFELMQELFTNVNRGTGATVIAASGGTQFAQEGGGLKNGVFTYSILELMQQQQGVTVSQLKTNVGKRVNELTHGLQQPTSRTENTENDWVVW